MLWIRRCPAALAYLCWLCSLTAAGPSLADSPSVWGEEEKKWGRQHYERWSSGVVSSIRAAQQENKLNQEQANSPTGLSSSYHLSAYKQCYALQISSFQLSNIQVICLTKSFCSFLQDGLKQMVKNYLSSSHTVKLENKLAGISSGLDKEVLV